MPHCLDRRGVRIVDFLYIGLIAALALASAGYLWLCDELEERK